jgi:predicted secreted protein
MAETQGYRDGTDLLLSVGTTALGHSTECKIAYKAETGTRKTKEAAAGKWDEKYVKSLGVTITASGFVYAGDVQGLPTLLALFIAHEPVDASWAYRDASEPHKGKFIITQLNQTGKAGDDEQYDITLENSGAIDPVTYESNAEKTALLLKGNENVKFDLNV